MRDYPALNFPSYTFRIRREGESLRVWDPIRRAWITLTPEEWVRQHMLRLFTDRLGIPATMIRLEYPVDIQGMPQRADAVVMDRTGRPVMVAECKAPCIDIDAAVYAQAVRYNSVLNAGFILLTNGMRHYCYRRGDNGIYSAVDRLPDAATLFRNV